jgi:hypothetical protein
MAKIVVGSSNLTQPLLLYSGLGPAMLDNIGGVNRPFFDTIHKSRSQWQYGYYMEMIVIAEWEIWEQRNNKIFRGEPPSFNAWKAQFSATVKLQLYRLKPDDRASVLDWLASLG